ncbi:hypothetical protein [Legionella sp. km772]|uniref:hypothetical protein n=1 Tax=Legionella sp. km772 TaxID=2498111 RepID=UPI000F8D981D|nr:hypothetical protein [Legionella sp. km772]RUR05012.1 hypothetical protein ELY15_14840 [Legionella sp. km772]
MRFSLLCSIVVLVSSQAVSAEVNKLSPVKEDFTTQTASAQNPLSHLWLSALGVYTDFKFNSTTGTNYNSYKGYSKLASVGGNNIQLFPGLTAGLALFRVETQLGSQILLNPGFPTHSVQSIRNNTLFGHLLKEFQPNFFVDLSGAYGRNKVNITSFLDINSN